MSQEDRLDKIENILSRLKEVPNDAFDEETSSSEDTCAEVKTDGEVCGRPLPCPYHSGDE